MIVTVKDLLIKYKDYKDPYGKIKREVDKKNIFPLVKGIYETDEKTPGYYLSSYIYGPSYLSFQYALSYHGLIPERVVSYTNATFGKNKRKKYENKFGLYLYRDIPKTAYPYGIKVEIINNYSISVAIAEKAICDMLYISMPQKNIKEIEHLLFEDLRIDYDEFYNLNFEKMLFMAKHYKSKNMRLLEKLLKKGGKDDNH